MKKTTPDQSGEKKLSHNEFKLLMDALQQERGVFEKMLKEDGYPCETTPREFQRVARRIYDEYGTLPPGNFELIVRPENPNKGAFLVFSQTSGKLRDIFIDFLHDIITATA
jgi:hypothetical protein